MGSRFTRRRFLAAAGAGAAYLALANTVGCESPEHAPRVSPLTGFSYVPPDGLWSFRSRPDLSPPAVEVTTQAHDTAPGYIFIAPEEGDAGQGGSLIVDNRGEVVWFRPLQGRLGRAHDLKVQSYRGKSVLTWMDGVNEYVIFDHSYREIARIKAGNGRDGDH